jgi:hypothetical protein
VFAALLRACLDGHIGYLPWVLLHESAGRREASRAGLARGGGRATTAQVVQALVRSFAPGPDRRDGARNLRALGRALAEWGEADAGAFDELVRGLLWTQMSRLGLMWDGLLKKYGGQPAFWADDVRWLLGVVREGVMREELSVPADVEEAFGADGRRRLQGLVGKFGALLEAWPALVGAARRMKAEGRAFALGAAGGPEL